MRARQAGFGLLELLVAMTVLLILLALFARSFQLVSRGMKRTTSGMETFEEVRSVAAFVGRDIGNALVRTTHANRNLSFRITDTSEGKAIYFVYPEEKVSSLGTMSFVTHCAYTWDRDKAELYRAAYNTSLDPARLMATASTIDNRADTAANRSRLTKMTLSYDFGGSWFSSPEMTKAIAESRNVPVLRNVFGFETQIFPASAPKPAANAVTEWTDDQSLPRSLQLVFRVANDRDAATLRRNPTQSELLRKFVIAVPMRNWDAYGNHQW